MDYDLCTAWQVPSFISPVDTIPDLTPAVGYADDLGVLAMAIALVAMNMGIL
jgi:Protein of unknown function (DUF1232).